MKSTFRLLSILLLSIVFFSCARNISTNINSNNNLVIYPPPPDTTRIQFLTKISNSIDITGSRKAFSKFIFGDYPEITIGKPYGIHVSKNKIYICDTYIHGLVIIDMIRNTFEQFIPGGKGELKTPLNCYVDKKGNLYIADSERKQIVIFDDKFNFLGSFGDAENFKPVDVFVNDNKIWVSNLAKNEIKVYSIEAPFKFLYSVSKSEKENGYLYSPINIYVTDEKLYVSDFGDFKIKIFDHQGNFLDTIGSYGKMAGQFARPKGIAVDKEANLYVVDAGFENVQIFDKDKKLLLYFGGPYKGPGDMWLPAKVTIDYEHLGYFQQYVDPSFKLKYLIFVTNQYGPDKITIYGAVEPSNSKDPVIRRKTIDGKKYPMFK
jgi:DNA-binding beta-propeller fold protein YncE